jgi:hypothetical protein
MKRLRLVAVLAGFVVATPLWTSFPSRAQSPSFDTAIVRLYSGGKVVGQWEAVGPGDVEGDTFVFPVRKGVQELEVRIRGTFSFEPQR